jgi:radical SAM superfamily enzyme YgiQ (UPF0313 family)
MEKTIIIVNFPRFSDYIWLPVLWSSAKTYYEKNGQKCDQWRWFPCDLDMYDQEHFDKITATITTAKPDIFAMSLYVWNYKLSHRVAEWVKINFPKCLIISGGPHQYFKHDINWFKKHWYIDASLPGDCYGEISIKEILDNYTDGQVDWDQVTDIRYPLSKNKSVAASRKTMTKIEKKYYDYDYAPYAEQTDSLKNFVEKLSEFSPRAATMALLETTRGCPYGCTYCDWGGGINTTVIKRSLENVKRDIDVLKTFYVQLYIGDANFGIFEERDIAIIRHLVDRPFWSRQRFKIMYGGFAKTENRLATIKKIIELDVKAGLSYQKEIKISMQTLDAQVLKNIDRKNISLDKQLAVLAPIAKNNKLPMYVELILGLPGMTLEKFYNELDILGSQKLSVQFYEWILLPESPAYANAYREKFGIKTVVKHNGWILRESSSDATIVVGADSFTTDDYLQMLLSASLYTLLVQGGLFSHCVEKISNKKIGIGQLIKCILEEFYMKELHQQASHLKKDWQAILQDSELPCQVKVGNDSVYIGWYFVALAFYDIDFINKLIKFLQEKFQLDNKVVYLDKELIINHTNFNQKYFKFPYLYDFTKENKRQNNFEYFLNLFYNFIDSGKVFTGRKKLFAVA